MISKIVVLPILLASAIVLVSARTVYDFENDFGGIPYNYSKAALTHNTATFTDILKNNASNSALLIPDKTFHFYPGIYAHNISDFQLFVNGTMRFHRPEQTPVNHYGRPEPCFMIEDSSDIVITSPEASTHYGESDDDDDNNDDDLYQGNNDDGYYLNSEYTDEKRGVIDGHGSQYWGIPFLGYVALIEFRPDLFVMNRTSNVLIEYLVFRDPGLYMLHLQDMYNLKIRYTSVVARRTNDDGHTLYDLSAFNTDGIDVSGQYIHFHDVDIWNQDDCIAVKDAPSGLSAHMLFERIHASGLGLTIGSIGGTTVRNITFQNSLLYKSYKGIYMKFRIDDWRTTPGLIENIRYENITMIEPEQWGIWIGPAQQAISGNPCKASPCSLCWPTIPLAKCYGIVESQYKNITLRNIMIHHPLGSPGVILADESTPIEGVTFDNVVVTETVPSYFKTFERHASFPGLNEPIHDTYMHPLNVWLYTVGCCALVMGIAALGVLGFMKIMKNKMNESAEKSSSAPLLDKPKEGGKILGMSKMNALLVFFVVIVATVVQGMVRTSENTYNKSSYFTCEGVVNGTAMGNSYPIPSCFTDQTDSNGAE